MRAIINLIGFLLLMSVSSGSTSCKSDDSNGQQIAVRTDEVRVPYVQEIDGKAVISWIDPYISDAKEVVVKDMQSNEEKKVALGVEKIEFDIADPSKLHYSYQIKVVREKGEISNGVTARLMKNWAQALHPKINYVNSSAPQTGMFFKNQPASAPVKVYDIRGDENISKLTSAVMQGVINQVEAKTYLVWFDRTREQLDELEVTYAEQPLAMTSANKGFAQLYTDYRDSFDKLVLWTEDQSWSWSLAVMICAQQNGIPVTQHMLDFITNEGLGQGALTIHDIRSQWSDKESAYNWAIDNLADNCHDKICFSGGLRSDYKDNPWRMYDYSAASKGFMFWLDETNEIDRGVMDRLFDKMQYPVGSSVFGFGMNTIGDDLNKATNTRNLGFVVSDYYENGSFWCSFPGKSFTQRQGIAGEVEAGKIYVAISLSDGDNIQFDQISMYEIFSKSKRRGEVPLGVTMAAGLQELNPKLLEYFYKNLTDNDELTAGPSGVQFIYGDYYVQSGKYPEWLQMNKKWLSTAGLHTVHLWNTETQVYFKQYMEESGVDLVMDGWDRTHSTGSAYKYVDGVIRIDQGTHCRAEGDVYRDLMSISPSPRRPLFRHLYLLTNYYGMDNRGEFVVYERLIKELERIERDNPNTFVFMLPMDLGATIKKYIEDGGTY